ncbi:MAGUK p55 subfamily member 7-like [Macaca nemestrina]|uniref:MAGUK p55 subfamily member 7-like n=1 Tax=Macaca nemestrina TaxID=9545 RepID=UPI0039B8D84A
MELRPSTSAKRHCWRRCKSWKPSLQSWQKQCCGTAMKELAEELQNNPLNSEIRELLKLLSKPSVKALLSVHNTVAQKNYDPVLPPMPEDIDNEEDSVKIIRLVKNREPLSASGQQWGLILQ